MTDSETVFEAPRKVGPDFYSDLTIPTMSKMSVYRLLVGGYSQSQAATILRLDKRAVHSMKNRLVRDKWLAEVEPRSYPRFYTRGPQGPLHGVPPTQTNTPLPPGVRLRYHNAAFGMSVETPIPTLHGWHRWVAGKGGSATMASKKFIYEGETHTVVLRGGTRQPTLVVHLPPVYAYSAEELVRVAHDAPSRARDVVQAIADETGIRLRHRPIFSVQTPEIALEDPNGYVASFWADRSEGFHEWETGALLLGYFAAKLLEERRLSVKSHPDVGTGENDKSNPHATCVTVSA